MKKSITIILITLALIVLVGAVSVIINIQNIKENPEDFANQNVVVEGKVTKIVGTVNTPPVAGAKFGVHMFILNDGTKDILVRSISVEDISESLTETEKIPRYDNQKSIKIVISEGDTLRVEGIVEHLPHAQELTEVTIKAIKIGKI